MSKFILFTNNILSARYDSDDFGPRKIEILIDNPDVIPHTIVIDNPNCKIPTDAIEVSEELFRRTFNEHDGIWSLVNDEVVKLPLPKATLAELKAEKLTEINASFNQQMRVVIGNVPDYEIASWSKQETQARAYQLDNSALTPQLDNLAAMRGITKADLVTRIIAKADLFACISGTLIGKRQGLEDELDALPETATAEDVAAIAW